MLASSTCLAAVRRQSKTLRTLHTTMREMYSSPRHRSQLVGPPDALSHLRPVVYENLPITSRVQHPYSLHEFRELEESSSEHEDDYGNYELKLRMAQQDAFNHEFWSETNLRFETAKASVLDALPPSATPEAREEALSHFYRHWVVNETARQRTYSSKLREGSRRNLFLAYRVWYRTVRAKLGL